MKKIIYSLLLLFTTSYAIDIDIDFIKKQVDNNSKDTNYRFILAKYYLQNFNTDKSQKYIDEIQKIDPSNKKIEILKKRVQTLKILQSKLNNINLANSKNIEYSLRKLYNEKEYKKFINIYEELKEQKIPLTQKSHFYAALAYEKIDQLHKCKLLLKIKEFDENEELIALKIRLALKNGESAKAKKLYAVLNKKYPSYKDNNKIKNSIEKVLKANKKKILKKETFKDLGESVYILTTQKKPNLAIKRVKKFLKSNKNHYEAKILLAKLYYWNEKPKNALSVLNSLKKQDDEAKTLLANLLYEKGEYKKALPYLSKMAKTAKTSKERYFLQKREAFSYAFIGDDQKAQRLFKKLLKKNPKDTEILKFQQEHQKQLLLKKAIEFHKQKDTKNALYYYETYYKQTHDPKIAREIAEIYYFDKKYNKAIKYFKKYLPSSPDDTLILFHLASSYEKKKEYKNAIVYFQKIINKKDPDLYYLSSYHCAYSLLQMQSDKEWLEAREILQKISKELQKSTDKKTKELIPHVNSLLKLAMGPVQKPTYYKDIVLTEGATKLLNRSDVFSDVNITTTTRPTLKMLLHNWVPEKKDIKPRFKLSTDYVSDSKVSYYNYQATIDDIAFISGVRYSAKISKFYFQFKQKYDTDGEGFFITAKKGNLTFEAGVEKFKEFNTFVPKITWSPVYGSHSLYIDLYYRSGAFSNYKSCMIENETSVIHAGIYDQILFEDLSYMELVFSLNSYDDENNNIYALINYPLFGFTDTKFDIEHKVIFNENFEYNSKTDLCYDLSKTYESSYIKYQPKFNFHKGYLQLSLGSGYSFKNSESVNSFALKGQYTINNFATFELNCERVQSSFTPDDINYCSFVLSQTW